MLGSMKGAFVGIGVLVGVVVIVAILSRGGPEIRERPAVPVEAEGGDGGIPEVLSPEEHVEGAKKGKGKGKGKER